MDHRQPLPTTPDGFHTGHSEWTPDLSAIRDGQTFIEMVQSLSEYFSEVIVLPYSFEQLRTASIGHTLSPLISHLSNNCHESTIIAALLVLKWHYAAMETDDHGVNATRGVACEIVAWRILTQLSESELIDYLLFELPSTTDRRNHQTSSVPSSASHDETIDPLQNDNHDEYSSLLAGQASLGHQQMPRDMHHSPPAKDYLDRNGQDSSDVDPTRPFVGLNALEIAAVAEAKNFLSQKVVQQIVNGIWRGEIVFWNSLSIHTKKKAQRYNKRRADPYSRLRVPKYQKVFEALFFAIFLALYYAVLVERNPQRITSTEVLLYIWIAAFAFEEYGEFRDAGTLFYAADFWSLWDLGIIGVGIAFLVCRVVGLVKENHRIVDISFDILSLEALFLVPRICALLSLHPYFGTLIPCLKMMTKDFIKFLGVVVILYMGFLTTFTLLARDHFTLRQISWTLIKVFFGSSSLGFDIASEISPALGPTLMLIFVCMTNILLITSLISLLSNSLTKVMDHAREEYLFQYSVFVLEASTSRRLTYYLPPLNLVPLILLRPLRLCIPAERLRGARIMLLKITHLPYVALIWAYESACQYMNLDGDNWRSKTQRKLLKKRMVLSSSCKRFPAVRNRSELSLVKGPADAHGSNEMSELKRMISRLKSQLDELTLRLDRQKSGHDLV